MTEKSSGNTQEKTTGGNKAAWFKSEVFYFSLLLAVLMGLLFFRSHLFYNKALKGTKLQIQRGRPAPHLQQGSK